MSKTKTLRIKSVVSFGLIGAIIGLLVGVFSNLGTSNIEIPFIYSIMGFICGVVLAVIIQKITKMSDEDWMKGLEYVCPQCKGGVFEIEKRCSICGKLNESFDSIQAKKYDKWKRSTSNKTSQGESKE